MENRAHRCQGPGKQLGSPCGWRSPAGWGQEAGSLDSPCAVPEVLGLLCLVCGVKFAMYQEMERTPGGVAEGQGPLTARLKAVILLTPTLTFCLPELPEPSRGTEPGQRLSTPSSPAGRGGYESPSSPVHP